MEEHGNPGPDDPNHIGPDPAQHPSNHSVVSESVVAEGSPARGKNDLFPEVQLLWLAITLIDAAPRRLRRETESQIKAVMRAIECFGFRVPILVRKMPGGERYQMIDGHTRFVAAQRLSAEVLPCIAVDDLPEVEIRRLALSLNKLQETSEWDPAALRLEIGEIIELSGTLEIPGFSMPELEAIRFGTEAAEVEDPADDLSALETTGVPVVSKPGDVWRLGDHVISCGSARDGAAVAALLDGQVADAVFSDPPYNVKINGHVRSAEAGYAEFTEASGEMSRPDFVAFLVETLGNAAVLLKLGGDRCRAVAGDGGDALRSELHEETSLRLRFPGIRQDALMKLPGASSSVLSFPSPGLRART
ncbi:ParB N-terminal domain-containing protein [Aestuariicoccus sp. MJ-SS9]|uniref:ParB N-terminal domain-containing protein n=1 Tax=Aestuariicoccus sp. MJ-SS9 TaxID=3079855 RepID=UPI00290CEF4A|nr:ParB N-terminal domain-containing protein [Aestuariicoccus sp. MJ-SS9]MDU8913212.1 ParB N-terminal domain-containing protein [Aestuariicoccus sp. MJ-SS9]